MASDFGEHLDELGQRVGEGTLSGSVEYDQAYAHRQHAAIQYKHEHGGQAEYLSSTLDERRDALLQHLADKVLDPEGVKTGMIEDMNNLADSSAGKVPLEHGTLRASAHPTVEENGALVYDRPYQRRLTDEELDKEHELTPPTREGRRRRRRPSVQQNEFRRTHYHRGVFPGEYLLRRRVRRFARRRARRRVVRLRRVYRRGKFQPNRVLKPSGFTGYAYYTLTKGKTRAGAPGIRLTIGGVPQVAGQGQPQSSSYSARQPKQQKAPTPPTPPRG